ncbi:PREDICTED: E3 ubiquitin-protein ligase RGLG1-like [Priapulus caudatus]|uniref:E3 ubiquitin-protein ligase RGLG1-like n=1 Tax=Priapulus caudatus TaxID=37621 RepID=A0ABM1EYS7_PRICU|nr:PREDICTED: E3 ubiquitin-protein ligase RGLG1-like [Priapulus caudatus]
MEYPWQWPWLHDLTALACFSVAMCIAINMLATYAPKPEKEGEIVALKRAAYHTASCLQYQQQQSLLSMLGLRPDSVSIFRPISDHFSTLSEVSAAIQRAGLDRCNLIIGIDFTASNEWQGRTTFGGQSLHATHPTKRLFNPYQKVIAIVGETLEPFADDKKLIPTFGFGDVATRDRDVFTFHNDGSPSEGVYDVLQSYNRIVRDVVLSGPTSFAPLIRRAINIVKITGRYHILVVVADGQMAVESPTMQAIVDASAHALSIIMVGVGDGPWEVMEEFDDQLPERRFDNFQFVNFHQMTRKVKNPEASFALHALMEIPAQYKTIRSLGYLDVAADSDDSGAAGGAIYGEKS